METLRKKMILESVQKANPDWKRQDLEIIIDSFLETIESALQQGDAVDLHGFGKFTVVERKERQGINPQTKEKITIPSSKAVTFKPAKALKDLIQ